MFDRKGSLIEMRHRKFPKKSSRKKKLKSVDPFNKHAQRNAELESKQKKLNLPPKNEDEQAVPKSMREFLARKERFEALEKASTSEGVKKKRNKILKKHKHESASSMEGFARRPYETDTEFLFRIGRETDAFVQEELMKIKFDLTGTGQRDVEEIKKGSKRKRSRNKFVSPYGSVGELSTQKKSDRTLTLTHKEKQTLAGRVSTSSCPANETESDRKNTWRKSFRKRKRAKRNANAEDARLLNAKDFVYFGERVDAPPEFGSVSGGKLRASLAKAGKRMLLLKKGLS